MAVPSISNAQLAAVVIGLVSYQVVATGSPTAWAITAGQLPPGLMLDQATGIISGAIQRTGVGQFSATIAATNGDGTGYGDVAFTVNPASGAGLQISFAQQNAPASGSLTQRIIPAKPYQFSPVAALSMPAPTLSGSVAGKDVTLSWNAVLQAAGYYVYRGDSSGTETLYATTVSPTFTDSNLDNGTYYYKAKAYNAIITSPYSNEVAETVSVIAARKRPSNPTIYALGTPRWYIELDRKMDNGTGGAAYRSTDSTSNFGAYMYASQTGDSPEPTIVSGIYDWGQGNAQIALDASGAGGVAGNFPASNSVIFRGGWFAQTTPGQSFDITYASAARAKVWLRVVNGHLLISGVDYTNLYDLFPAGWSTGHACGTFPNDTQWHHVAFTLTNDGGGAGGLLNVWVDGVLVHTEQGHIGAYWVENFTTKIGGFGGAYGPNISVGDQFAYDFDASSSLTSLIGVSVTPGPKRPNNTVIESLGLPRFYYPLDRTMSYPFSPPSSYNLYPSTYSAGTGSFAEYQSGANVLDTAGHYDYARRQTQLRLNGNAAYPTIFTSTRGGWFKHNSGLVRFDLCWSNGGASQFYLWVQDGQILCYGYDGSGYMFPVTDPPFFAAEVIGNYPADTNWHHMAWTITNDATLATPCVMKFWLDGTLIYTSTSARPGAYFGNDNIYTHVGGFEGSAPQGDNSIGDQFAYDFDAAALIPIFAGIA